jgi:hypothetical protein
VEYVLTAEESLPLSSKSAFLADTSRVHYSTNGYQIDNELNCTHSVAHCFDQYLLHRLSYDGNRSIAFIKDKMVLNNMVTSGDQKVTFRQFLNQRGHNPHIIVLS